MEEGQNSFSGYRIEGNVEVDPTSANEENGNQLLEVDLVITFVLNFVILLFFASEFWN